MSWLIAMYDRIPDWVWPHLSGEEPLPPSDQIYFSVTEDSSPLIDSIGAFSDSRALQVENRLRSVDARLTSLLTLTSVLSAAFVAGLAAAATLGNVDQSEQGIAYLVVLIVFYLGIQLLRSVWATVSGLMRREFKHVSPSDIRPKSDEGDLEYRLRILNLQVCYFQWNDWAIDEKVSQMAVAHTALRNALTASFFLIIVTLTVAVRQLL